MDFLEPDKAFKNYIWDTQALNALAEDEEMISLCQRAIEKGHRYYITMIQQRELSGVPDRKMNYDNPNAWGHGQKNTIYTINKLGFACLSCVAQFYVGFWLLDGSMRILDNSGIRIDMYNDIYNRNKSHKRDATIAEAAAYHECTLITDDKRLHKKVNKYYPSTAITYDDYKKCCRNLF